MPITEIEKIIEKIAEQEKLNPLQKDQVSKALKAPLMDNNLIGIDISDVMEMFQVFNRVHVEIMQADLNGTISETLEKIVNLTEIKCKKVYMNISGDISLFDAEEAVNKLEESLGEEVDILWSANYDDEKENEYEMTIIFIE